MQTIIKMQFDPEIASKVGVEEAIMYSNLQFWCVHNKANGQHFHDGSYWTYNSYEAFCELFPFWTEKQIRRILRKLEEHSYIKVGNYNRKRYDKTKWYSTDCPNAGPLRSQACVVAFISSRPSISAVRSHDSLPFLSPPKPNRPLFKFGSFRVLELWSFRVKEF